MNHVQSVNVLREWIPGGEAVCKMSQIIFSLVVYLNTRVWTYYLKLKVVSQARRAVHPQQNGVFLLGAEPEGQPVRPGAGTLVRRPRVDHHTSVTAKDIGGPSWLTQIKNLIASMSVCCKQCYVSSEGLHCRWNLGLLFKTETAYWKTIIKL